MTPRRSVFAVAATTVAALLGGLGALFARPAHAESKHHRVVFQVSSSDAGTMDLVIHNMGAMQRDYGARGEAAALELVCFGPGLAMLRADLSPVKDGLASLKGVTLSACNNTIQGREKEEGKKIVLVEGARVVPSGVVRIAELQEQGWSYLRP